MCKYYQQHTQLHNPPAGDPGTFLGCLWPALTLGTCSHFPLMALLLVSPRGAWVRALAVFVLAQLLSVPACVDFCSQMSVFGWLCPCGTTCSVLLLVGPGVTELQAHRGSEGLHQAAGICSAAINKVKSQ